jgi:hypothetical protein
MTTISSSNLLSDILLFVRDTLIKKISDPLDKSNIKRPKGQKFIFTSYPKDKVIYPTIYVRGRIVGDRKLGQQSEQSLIQLAIEVKISARNEKEKNDLTGEVYDALRKNQYPSGTDGTSTNTQLWDFGINFANDLDDPGEEGTKRKICECRYSFVAN